MSSGTQPNGYVFTPEPKTFSPIGTPNYLDRCFQLIQGSGNKCRPSIFVGPITYGCNSNCYGTDPNSVAMKGTSDYLNNISCNRVAIQH